MDFRGQGSEAHLSATGLPDIPTMSNAKLHEHESIRTKWLGIRDDWASRNVHWLLQIPNKCPAVLNKNIIASTTGKGCSLFINRKDQ